MLDHVPFSPDELAVGVTFAQQKHRVRIFAEVLGIIADDAGRKFKKGRIFNVALISEAVREEERRIKVNHDVDERKLARKAYRSAVAYIFGTRGQYMKKVRKKVRDDLSRT